MDRRPTTQDSTRPGWAVMDMIYRDWEDRRELERRIERRVNYNNDDERTGR